MAKSQPFKITETKNKQKGCPEKLAGTAFFYGKDTINER